MTRAGRCGSSGHMRRRRHAPVGDRRGMLDTRTGQAINGVWDPLRSEGDEQAPKRASCSRHLRSLRVSRREARRVREAGHQIERIVTPPGDNVVSSRR